jgi:hypothetical protein
MERGMSEAQFEFVFWYVVVVGMLWASVPILPVSVELLANALLRLSRGRK